MTEWGGKIPDLTVEELQSKLADTEDDGKAVKRLVAAIAYKQGHSPAEIEETFGFSKKNLYLWLDRFEERELDEALYDEPKPGRPPKLTDDQFAELEAVLHKSPEYAGYEGIQAWTPKFVQHWLNNRFDVEYTLRHIRRLMDKAGLSWRTARPEHYEADPEEIADFQETFKKATRTDRRQKDDSNGRSASQTNQNDSPTWVVFHRLRSNGRSLGIAA